MRGSLLGAWLLLIAAAVQAQGGEAGATPLDSYLDNLKTLRASFIEVLVDSQVGMLSDRRIIPPYGLAGGKPGATGKNEIVVKGRRKKVPSKCGMYVPAGSVVRIETPGGGGWGK